MNFKEELISLVELVKSRAKKENRKLTNADIANRLKLNRSYFQTLLSENERGNVEEKHLTLFRAEFKDELEDPALRTGKEVADMAHSIMILQELAKLKSQVFGGSFDDNLRELHDTEKNIVKELLAPKPSDQH